MVMQPTHLWHFPDRANLRPLDRPRERTIHLQGPVGTPMMVMLKVLSQPPPQMLLAQDNYVVQAFATDTPDEPFDVWILPETPGRNQHLFDPHIVDTLSKVCPINTVAIPQQVA
jgi:hypothetical protein